MRPWLLALTLLTAMPIGEVAAQTRPETPAQAQPPSRPQTPASTPPQARTPARARHPCPPGGDPEGEILVRQEGVISCREWWRREAEHTAEMRRENQRLAAMTEEERNALRERLLNLIREELRDGPAARFQRIRFIAEERAGAGATYCVWGRVNDKNQFGGYAGFVPFTARITVDAGNANGTSYMPQPIPHGRGFECAPTDEFPGF